MYSELYKHYFEDEDNDAGEASGINEEDSSVFDVCQQQVSGSLPLAVVYVHSANHVFECSRLPRVRGRSLLVHGLIRAYGLLPQLRIVHPRPASDTELKSFHSEDYINFLQSCESSKDLELEEEKAKEYNLVDDCPLVKSLYTIIRYIAGGTLTAARALITGTSAIAIHWEGGWHHGQRSEAAGFCYVNDVVLGIQELCQHFGRVLYVDLDVHHGDGVQEAFCATDRVLTLSFHNHETGFYPGTGSLEELGYGRGKGYCLNVPLQSGIGNDAFVSVAKKVLDAVLSHYQPDVIVCQCGVDGLSGDPLGAFNLTQSAFVECLQLLMSKCIPLLVLGGGGYVPENAARCWTQLTATLVGKTLEDDVPEHKFLLKYGPSYELKISPGLRQDCNATEYLERVTKTVLDRLDMISSPEQRTQNCALESPSDVWTGLRSKTAPDLKDGLPHCP
ncbi:histone deacetylase 8-like [Ornithodoros turicata]|uniref:histone deacetylase 8-like n=1 Tax=Ornithodoros turicata TaxID=34597 RepID=UPI0031391F90